MNWNRDGYELTDESARIDLDVVCALLRDTYWSADRSRAAIEKSLQHSVCFGLWHAGRQV